ncbi:MAG: choice-of-anchor L domain-containing protein, partial [Flavobacteriales bacterium]
MIKKILFFLLLISQSIYSQDGNLPPEIFSEGNEFYCPLTEQAIVTSFDIVDPDDDSIEALYIQISEGYVQGEDVLTLNGVHQGITEDWDDITGKLELKGPGGADALYTDIIAAVYDIMFSSSNPNPTDKSFSFTIGDANYLASTGHYYLYIDSLNITWQQSKTAAESQTYYGLQGYLATIMSPEESQIAIEQASATGWIGASDAEVEGQWDWVTGPEAGTNFWNGNFNGSAVPGMYSNWNNDPPEPNQTGDEDFAHITDPLIGLLGSWNDLGNTGNDSGPYQPKGYIVEFGGMLGDPDLNLSSSTSLLAPFVEINVFNACANEFTGLEASSNIGSGEVYWYESVIGGDLVSTGTTYNPDITETTSYFISPFAPGICDNYDRLEVPAIFIPAPTPVAPNVTVDQCTYTVEELVTEILINDECSNISNITFSTGTNFNDVNGIGYFSEISDSFEFSEGLILSSGDANLGTGPNSGSGQGGPQDSGGFGWPGDEDLTNLLDGNTENASVIEFDFIPLATTLSFRFIMASEEYDQAGFECNFSDVFGFFLTNENGVTTNLAVIPDTDIPIAITNIHPANSDCNSDGVVDENDAANPEYFGEYVDIGVGPIAYDGYTRAFTAQSEVNIGETYNIKLAVADATDNLLDSAVFLEAGSFDISYNIGEDIFMDSPNAPCIGTEFTLDAQIENALSYTWYKDGDVIIDENESSLLLSETATYSVEIEYATDCTITDDILIEFFIPETVDSPLPLFSCDNNTVDGIGIFDLTEQTSILSNLLTGTYEITYFELLENAENNIDVIENPESFINTINYSQPIYVRLVEESSNCFTTTSFEINTINPPIITIPTPFQECDNDYDGIDIFDLSQKTDELLTAGESNVTVSYHETQVDADNADNPITEPYSNINSPNSQIIFARLTNTETFCFATTPLELVVNPIPEVIDLAIIEVCD